MSVDVPGRIWYGCSGAAPRGDRRRSHLHRSAMLALIVLVGSALAHQPPRREAGAAPGPLRVHPTNPRYFTDGTKTRDSAWKAVYLTGSHTWANLIDRGVSDPPPTFDF